MLSSTRGHLVTMFSQSVRLLAYYICWHSPRSSALVVRRLFALCMGVKRPCWSGKRPDHWEGPEFQSWSSCFLCGCPWEGHLPVVGFFFSYMTYYRASLANHRATCLSNRILSFISFTWQSSPAMCFRDGKACEFLSSALEDVWVFRVDTKKYGLISPILVSFYFVFRVTSCLVFPYWGY